MADDQESDQHLLVRSLKRLGVLNPVHRVADGHEAIRYLNGDTPYNDRNSYPLPAIIFLDLKLPMISGWEVLDWILNVGLKGESRIFVYSEILDLAEIRKIYRSGADSYLGKPINELELMNLIYYFPKHWYIQVEESES
ncbi:MAG: response regulator receiver protein [Verrucomicrobiales bacterium]|nr:response regulator receiver protein [Verrucomicrobiales bacterium]